MSTLIPREMKHPAAAVVAAFLAADERGQAGILEHALSAGEDWPAPARAATSSARLDELIARAFDLSAVLASAKSMQDADQVELLLTCSSLADVFARDLDFFVGEPK